MDDPRRLIDDSTGSSIGRALIASARTDAPSARSRVRVARRLGIVAVLAAGAGAGSEAGAIAATWKLAMVMLALGGVVGLAMWQSPASEAPALPRVAPIAPAPHTGEGPASVQRQSIDPTGEDSRPAGNAVGVPTPLAPASPIAAPPASAAPVPSATEAPPAHAPRPVARGTAHPIASRVDRPAKPLVADKPAVEPPASAEPAIASAPEAQPTQSEAAGEAAHDTAHDTAQEETVTQTAPPVPAAPASDISGPSRLAAEVALVDRARARLAAGDATAALAAIAEYHQRFAGGDLDAEADVVTIEAVIAQKDVARAHSLGDAFLARFPRSPHAQRVRSLLDRLPK